MKKSILLFLCLTLIGNVLFAQNDLSEIDKLVATAKVWGFLKYYHPNVASGKYNWDEELFIQLSEIKEASTRDEFSFVLINWIKKLGDVKKCKKCNTQTEILYFNKNFDLSWIENDQIFTSEISNKLRYIETNRHQGKKYYVAASKKFGKIEVKNEIDYEDFDWRDENFRMLSLFRYWNIIEYFFPYKYQTDTEWDEVLMNMIPKFQHPETEEDFHLAILELTVSIDDSHAGFSSEITRAHFGNYWVPVIIKLIDDKAVVFRYHNDSLARTDDLRVGDAITKINGKDVKTVFQEKEKYTTGSNISRKKYTAAYNFILNGASDSVNIEYVRNGKAASKTIRRYLFKDLNIHWKDYAPFKILDGNIGYVNMGVLKIKDVANAMDNLNETKAIIFDLRTYPKRTSHSLVRYISSQRNDFYKVVYPDLNYPGKFIWRDGILSGTYDELKYKGKVVLLVNERSQSQAEFTAMCLQTGDDVTTIGSQTSGADGDTSEISLVGGFKTKISGVGIFYPDRTETQRKGVKIDINMKPTIQGIIEGRDEVLDRAIEYVNE